MEEILQELSSQLGMPLEEVRFKYQKIRDTEAMYQHAIQELYQTDEVIIAYASLLPYSEVTKNQKRHGSVTCPAHLTVEHRKRMINALGDFLVQHLHYL